MLVPSVLVPLVLVPSFIFSYDGGGLLPLIYLGGGDGIAGIAGDTFLVIL